MPPEWMWSVDEELETWFEQVEEDRREKWGNRGGGRERDERPPLMQNALTKGRARR